MAARVESALAALRSHAPPDELVMHQLAIEAATAFEELVVADEELRAQAEELAVSRDAVDAERERYAELFEAIPDAVVETDHVGKIVEANRAATELLAVPDRAVRDKLLASFVESSSRAQFRRWLREPPVTEVVFKVERRDGSRRTVAATVGRQDRGEVRVLWVLRDLSAAAELERRLEEMGTALTLFERLSPLQRLATPPTISPALFGRVVAVVDELVTDLDLVIRMDGQLPVTGVGALGVALAAAETTLGEGPTLEAIVRGVAVVAVGLELGRQWPRLGPVALDHQASAVIAVPVVVDGEPLGAVAGWQHGAQRAEDVLALLHVVAGHLAVAASNVRLYGDAVAQGLNLRKALETRGVIERAKGMLMHASGLSSDEAFAALRAESQRQNRKLRDVALDVTEKGGLLGSCEEHRHRS